jgi:hypothetical protein
VHGIILQTGPRLLLDHPIPLSSRHQPPVNEHLQSEETGNEPTPETRGAMIEQVEFPVLPIVKAHFIINSVLAFLTVLVVGLRLTARFMSGAGLWWDDYLILFALPQGLGMLIIQGLCECSESHSR